MSGYFYIRTNEWTNTLGIFKLGITCDLGNRHKQYLTYEPNLGKFEHVYEVSIEKLNMVEKIFKTVLNGLDYHYYTDGGVEYYKIDGLKYIDRIFVNSKIEYKKLTDENINILCQPKDFIIEQKNENKDVSKLCKDILELLKLKPKPHQQKILSIVKDFYKENSIGKLIWTCGLGKSLMSLFICMEMGYKNIIIGVPNVNLQHQFKDEILKVFPFANILFVGGEYKDDIETTTDVEVVKKFKDEIGYKFIITTYSSCHILANDEFNFDFKIGDEAHHLTGLKTSDKSFLLFHKINSKHVLFMTATEKLIEQKTDTLYTMDDTKIFGEYIDKKSLNWAIENKYVTDYSILLLKNTEKEVLNIIKCLNIKIDNPDLFISAFMAIKSMKLYSDLTHILIYTNTTLNADIVKEYIDLILELNIIQKKNFYNNSLHSNKRVDYKLEVNKFTESERGIICCVDVFGEGFDPVKLSGVCFAENMESEIRIFQCSQRSGRLEQFKNMSYIILPYIDNGDWDNKSFKKCRNILSTYRLLDETVERKIKMVTLKETYDKAEKKDIELIFIDLIDNDDELSKFKISLKYSKLLNSDINEYEYMKTINKKFNLNTKNAYLESCNIHPNFIYSVDEYFKLKKMWKGWIDFLGLEGITFIETKEKLISFCLKNNIYNREDYYEACKIYKQLPPEPTEFYTEFTNINFEFKKVQKRR